MSIWSGPRTRRTDDEGFDARVFNPHIDPFPIDPDLLGKARNQLSPKA